MHELLRLPLLVSHFLHHKAEQPGMDMAKFLALHYTDDHPNDQDEEEDNDLPFKEGQLQHVDPGYFNSTPETIPVSYFPFYIVPLTIGIPLQKSFTIFRPPQFV